jgi:hypothetical protein
MPYIFELLSIDSEIKRSKFSDKMTISAIQKTKKAPEGA